MNKLEEARLAINSIDKEMAELFEKRMQAVEDVVNYKMENKMQVLDASREKEIIKRNVEYIENEDYQEYYLKLFDKMLELSKTYQRRIINKDKIAYQGVEGAFAHQASIELFPDSKHLNFASFEEVIKAVENGEVKYGVLPYENSYTGEVGEVSDLLRDHEVYINQVYDLKISQNLIGLHGSKISEIKEVYSHPQALKQSAKYLSGRDIEIKPYANTALAAKFVKESNDKTKAAIASVKTASLYDLEVLEADIQTSSSNTTRFIVISKDLKPEGNHFQIIFDVLNETGTLASAINLIAEYNLNMVSIKSRSIPKKPWEYYFQVEIEGNLHGENEQELISKLAKKCTFIKMLGSYNR